MAVDMWSACARTASLAALSAASICERERPGDTGTSSQAL